jgi:hypothetical protein
MVDEGAPDPEDQLYGLWNWLSLIENFMKASLTVDYPEDPPEERIARFEDRITSYEDTHLWGLYKRQSFRKTGRAILLAAFDVLTIIEERISGVGRVVPTSRNWLQNIDWTKRFQKVIEATGVDTEWTPITDEITAAAERGADGQSAEEIERAEAASWWLRQLLSMLQVNLSTSNDAVAYRMLIERLEPFNSEQLHLLREAALFVILAMAGWHRFLENRED